MRKVASADGGGQSSGFLIDRVEDRWYVWRKLNKYDKSTQTGWTGRHGGAFSLVFSDSLAGLDKKSNRPELQKQTKRKSKIWTLCKNKLVGIIWRYVTYTMAWPLKLPICFSFKKEKKTQAAFYLDEQLGNGKLMELC